MTKAQERKVKMLRRQAETEFSFTEVKTFEVEENEYFVSVYAVIGLPEDEGTMAAVFARDSIHVFIGKKGGITYPVSKQLKNGQWKHYTKRYERFLATSLDQRHV